MPVLKTMATVFRQTFDIPKAVRIGRTFHIEIDTCENENTSEYKKKAEYYFFNVHKNIEKQLKIRQIYQQHPKN
jgi:hypothetical protein